MPHLPASLAQLLDPTLIAAERLRRARLRVLSYYPDSGPLRRELYAKHLEFFEAGASHRERAAIMGNRCGKTVMGGYETALHLTGDYPGWWQGRRFAAPVKAWAAGDTSKTVRDILQAVMLGNPGSYGTGMIPGDSIRKTTARTGLADAVELVYVKHVSGGTSVLNFKSYDQRREAFQGTAQDVVWADEECPQDIYTECLLRTMTTNGLLYTTFTPLQGLSEVVLSFLPGGQAALPGELGKARHCTMAGWDDIPHLSAETKAELLAAIPPHQRDARSKGVPQLGSGAIYPVPESDVVVKDFDLPAHWPRAYGLDVGWNRTACIWGALDRDTDTVYLYSEHYRGEAEPVVHAQSIKSRGAWIPGVIDPAARGRGQSDGLQLMQKYVDLGLDLEPADNAVEAGLFEMWQRLSGGRLRVFESLSNWRQEFRLYRRDEKGKVVKEHDHMMDACRYLVNGGFARAITKPVQRAAAREYVVDNSTGGWMT